MEYTEICQKIKALRLKRNFSIQELAKRASLTPGYLSKIENSENPPPIPTLSKLAYALNVHISYFFDEEKEEEGISIIRKGERKEIIGDFTALGFTYEAIMHRRPNSVLNSFVLTAPGELDPDAIPYNSHDGEELIYVLQGEMRFYYGDDEYLVAEGDCLYFNAAIPHKVICATPTGQARMLAVLSFYTQKNLGGSAFIKNFTRL